MSLNVLQASIGLYTWSAFENIEELQASIIYIIVEEGKHQYLVYYTINRTCIATNMLKKVYIAVISSVQENSCRIVYQLNYDYVFFE